MKRCPKCCREYDNTMMFCLDDGAELLHGPASLRSIESPTAILPSVSAPNEPAIFLSADANTSVFQAIDDRSIAVLPFVSMSADVVQELLQSIGSLG